MRVDQFMTPRDKVPTCTKDATIEQAAKLIAESTCGCVIVVQEDEQHQKTNFPIAIITKSNLVRVILEKLDVNEPVSRVMHKGVVAITKDKNTEEAANVFLQEKVNHLVVIDGPQHEFIGVVSTRDIASEVSLDAKAFPYNRTAIVS